MSEQRLIDVDALKEKEQYIPCGNGLLFHGVTAATIDAMPTIDPDALPIVRELREKLERVTAERDAAVSDLENVMAYNSDTCQLCKNNQCYVRGGTKPCLPKWRGPDGDHP